MKYTAWLAKSDIDGSEQTADRVWLARDSTCPVQAIVPGGEWAILYLLDGHDAVLCYLQAGDLVSCDLGGLRINGLPWELHRQRGGDWHEAVDEINREIRRLQSFKDAKGWIDELLDPYTPGLGPVTGEATPWIELSDGRLRYASPDFVDAAVKVAAKVSATGPTGTCFGHCSECGKPFWDPGDCNEKPDADGVLMLWCAEHGPNRTAAPETSTQPEPATQCPDCKAEPGWYVGLAERRPCPTCSE